ncbi:MAG: signal recognition particle-docking protein FtsY [Anaerolineaceae bacterium]|nr:signal recognition particle-docking protein FtsY [Anaerolineaceae bacterium]
MADIFNKWIKGLEKTRKVAFGRLAIMFGQTEIENNTWDDLEELLIQADLGISTTQKIIVNLMRIVDREGLTKTADLHEFLKIELENQLTQPVFPDFSMYHPAIIIVVGVNGSGKTTTLAKLGKVQKDKGKKVMFAAADTFRAAAVDQLQIWGDRLSIPVISGQDGADPGSVAYDAIQAGISRNVDFVFVDTAGRLHTRFNLMEELKKVNRVISKTVPGAPHATWLVLDATTGQNALTQAKAFKEAVNINGVILTKLDGSARGGMLFAIQQELNLPILYVGLGEKPEDLQIFDPHAFVEGLIS